MEERKTINPHEERATPDFTNLELGKIVDQLEELGGISGSHGHYSPEEIKKLIAAALQAKQAGEEQYEDRLLRITGTGRLRTAVQKAIDSLPAGIFEKSFEEAKSLGDIFEILDEKQLLAGSARIESAATWRKQIEGMIRLPEVLGRDRPDGVPPVPTTESLLSVITNHDGLRDAVRRVLFGPAYVAQYKIELEKRKKS